VTEPRTTEDKNVARAAALDTATLSDALDKLGILGQCHKIHGRDHRFRLTGRAYTLRYGPAATPPGTVGDYIDDVPPGAVVVTSLTQAITACGHVARICVIGGAQIYDQALALGLADEIIATEVKAEVEGDAFFPALPEGQWQEITRLPQPEENGYAYDFVTYSRVAK